MTTQKAHNDTPNSFSSAGERSKNPKRTGYSQALIQAKLTIGEPGDIYEKEADAMADTVMRMPEPGKVQRKCAECEEEEKLQKKPSSGNIIPFAQKKCAGCENEEKENLQMKSFAGSITRISRKESGGSGNTANPDVESGINRTRGSGSKLTEGTRSFMESRFGADFSGVNIYTGSESVQMNRELNARAFTVGSDIHFSQGKYNPSSDSGKHLLAHELTHTVQQGAAGGSIQRKITVKDSGDVPSHFVKANMNAQQIKDAPPEYIDRTAGKIVESMLSRLCPEGKWSVNNSGEVKQDSESPCEGEGPSASSHPASCTCICELTSPNSLKVFVHITDKGISPEGDSTGESLADHGHGETRTDLSVPVASREFHVAVSGFAHEVLGVGDTTVSPDAKLHKKLRDPAWLILGHEMCGHVRKDLSFGSRDFEHTMSEDYDTSAVDIENAIRREHSIQADNYGIRFGEFWDFSGCRHYGSVYQIKFGARVSTLENKFNIPHEYAKSQNADGISENSFLNCDNRKFDPHSPNKVYKHVFAHREQEPVAFILKGCRNHHFEKGDKVFLEGVFAHRVIDGDTKRTIATMWNVSFNKLYIANMHINNLDTFSVNEKLPIGMTVVIPFDRNAAKVFHKCF